MATTSTIPAVKQLLVSEFTIALADASPSGGQVPVDYAWPGPSTDYEAVFLGYHPEVRDIRLRLTEDIPTLKAGRKQRQETYQVPVTIWCFRPDLTSAGAQTAEARAFAIFAYLEDVLADDPRLSSTLLHWAKITDLESTLFPFQKGWACELVVQIDVQARLT